MRHFMLACSFVLSASSALAHPHVFVDAEGTFVIDDDGRLTGIRIYWLYDAFTTLVLYDTLDLDKDNDGELDQADLDKVVEGETDWPPDYEGDTYLWVNDIKYGLSRPVDGSALVINDRVGVSFELHLDTPVEMSGQTASLKLYDPSFYYAYSIPGEGRIDGPAEGCHLTVNRFSPDAQAAALQEQLSALSQDEMPADPNIGALFAEEIVLQCD